MHIYLLTTNEHKLQEKHEIKNVQNRYAWIDYIRGIAIILVVYRHVLEGISRAGFSIEQYRYLQDANIMFFSFRMPLFFIVSGIFVTQGIIKKSLKGYLSNRFATVFYPFVLWAFLQITLQFVFSSYVNADRSLFNYADLFIHPRRYDHFWYLYALFNVSVLYALVQSVRFVKLYHQLALGFLLYLASALFAVLKIDIGMLYDIMHYYLFFAAGDFISSFIFREKTSSALSSVWLLAATAPFFAAAQYYFLVTNTKENSNYYVEQYQPLYFLVISLTGCLFITSLSFILQKTKAANWLKIIGYHSLYIYVMHVMMSSLVRNVLSKFLHVQELHVLLFSGVVCGVLLPVVFYKIAMKIGAKWLFELPREFFGARFIKGSETKTGTL